MKVAGIVRRIDDLEERALAVRDPAMFLQLHNSPVIIDEIQYALQLFSYINGN